MQQTKVLKPWPRWAKAICFTALAITVAFIFSNSMQVGVESAERSGSILSRLLEWLPFLGGWFTEHILRKLGHFLEYALAGFWLLLCLRSCTTQIRKYMARPLLAGILIALSDETIQLFVAGRSGQVTDVWIDSFGVVCGLLVTWCIVGIIEIYAAHKRGKTGGAV